jgi:hypothetical protein
MFLTVETVICDKPEKEGGSKAPMGMPGMGGGMPMM